MGRIIIPELFMKYKWPFLFLVFVLTVIGVYYVNFSENTVAVELPPVNDLPMLNIKKTDGDIVMLHDVQGKTVLIFFNPDCDHCQNEARQISERKQIFRDYAVYFISVDSMQNIMKFADEHKLKEANFYFAQTEGGQVLNTVGPLPSVPAIFIYNNKKLVKKFEGEVKLEELMKFL